MDSEVRTMRTWIKQDSGSDWSLVRSDSLAIKACWQQFEFLRVVNGVVYSQLKILNTKAEP